MDVLNTYGGGTDVALILLGILACALGFILLIAGVVVTEAPAAIFGLLMILVGMIALFNANEPIRHEVTLRPGHVIDAVKYEVIEQRGAIYVIKEREVSE